MSSFVSKDAQFQARYSTKSVDLPHHNLPRMRLDLLQEKADAKRKEAR